MISELNYLYQIDINNIIEITNIGYKVVTNKSYYFLKKVDSLNKEKIYIRLSLAKVNYFNIPLKSINNRFIEEIDHQYYTLSYYYNDETLALDELRMSFYLKAIGYLHQNTIYPLKVNDGYFKESLDYIENKIMSVRDMIDSRMTNIERNEYHSPSDWYFISSYRIFNNAINESQKYLDDLNDESEKLHSIELCLTYQNYSTQHIIIKEEKIISLEKMALAPSIYDLVDFVEKNFNDPIDISTLLNNYLSINQLALYQKYWLLALLYIPKINKETDDLKDIQSLYLSIVYLQMVEKIKQIILPQTETE